MASLYVFSFLQLWLYTVSMQWHGLVSHLSQTSFFGWEISKIVDWYFAFFEVQVMLILDMLIINLSYSCCHVAFLCCYIAGGQSVCVHQFFWNSNLLCQNCTQYCWSICWPKAGCISRDDGNDDAGKDDDVHDDDGDDVDDDSNMWWWCGYRLAEHYLPPWESSFLPVQSQYLDTLPATHRHEDQVFSQIYQLEICRANYQKCQFLGVKKQLPPIWDVWLSCLSCDHCYMFESFVNFYKM